MLPNKRFTRPSPTAADSLAPASPASQSLAEPSADVTHHGFTISDELKADILKSIALNGAASEENAEQCQIVLGSRSNLNHIADSSSGRIRLRASIAAKFRLLVKTPDALSALNPFEIRCVLCRSVISYPAWYYSVRYAVNHFHYFVCFDDTSPGKPTTRCFKR